MSERSPSASACIICGQPAHPYCTKGPATYWHCARCDGLYQDPMPSAETLAAYAEGEYDGGVYLDYARARGLKLAQFSRRLALIEPYVAGRRLLDVGCASGYFVECAVGAGFDAHGVEWSAAAAALASPPIAERIRVAHMSAYLAEDSDTYDIITAFDIVEHSTEPIALLDALRRKLNPGGLLVLTTPDTRHPLRYLMRGAWPHLQPLQHTVLFSRRSMRIALRAAGFNRGKALAATKVLTPDYLESQVRIHTPALAHAYRAVAPCIPVAVRQHPFSVNIGEFMMLAAV